MLRKRNGKETGRGAGTRLLSRRVSFSRAVETALEEAMLSDDRIIIMGEDVRLLRRNLYVRFGPSRVLNTPISEAAFLGAAVGAAMAGLHPVVEIMMVDFMGVAFDALLNHASKTSDFSGGKWKVPVVIRTSCGGGYGDGGQHEQCLWGILAALPGLAVAVPSNPADAAGLMLSALESEDPVVYMEHKLLSDYWLDYLGAGGRKTVRFDIPRDGAWGEVDRPVQPVPLGKAAVKRRGEDLTVVSLGVGLHRALEAAEDLSHQGVEAEVIDLRTVSPLDGETVAASAARTGRVLVVDEDYTAFGLSGEIAAVLAEAGVRVGFKRVGTDVSIPYARRLEERVLPGKDRILAAAMDLLG